MNQLKHGFSPPKWSLWRGFLWALSFWFPLTGIHAAAAAAVQINEVMARNVAAVTDSAGRSADWVELYNSDAADVDLSGMRLIAGAAQSDPWFFPAGVRIKASGFLVIWCDNSRSASLSLETDLNTGHALPAESGEVLLYDAAGVLMDALTYGFQVADLSLGRAAGNWQLLARPTPGSTNAEPATLGDRSRLRINEWVANPQSGDDWFELYNLDSQPVSLGGLMLVSDPSGAPTAFKVPELCFIGAQDWVLYSADKKTNSGPGHVNFNLSAKGDSLAIQNTNNQVIDRIDFGSQLPGVSEGRLPDGGAAIVKFFDTPSPGDDNHLPLTYVWFNEVLTHTDPPLEDAVELYTPNSTEMDISGWFLSNSASNLKKYRIPDGTIIPAGGFIVLYENQFAGSNHFTFNSAHGDTLYLSTADREGNLTGYRVKQSFGAASNGVSFGRYQTSLGADFVPLAARTFGRDNPATVEEFRRGRGASNALPKVGPVVINEIMYHPPDTGGTNAIDNVQDEYIELYNFSYAPIPLFDPAVAANTWKIKGDVEYTFPQNTWIPAGGHLLLVSFDPAKDAAALNNFRTNYGLAAQTLLTGPYLGKLGNASGVIELYQPDKPQAPPHPDAGFIPYVMIEKIKYEDAAPWPVEPDGSSASLQRKNPTEYANDYLNWRAGTPTAGRPNETVPVDSDEDGLPDIWEAAYGLDPHNPEDALLDMDGDGMNNLQEFWSGTDPTNAKNVLKLTAVRAAGGDVLLRFKAVAGQSYALEAREAEISGAWQILTNAPPLADTVTLEWTETPKDSPGRWYRVRTFHAP